jgi:SAM-dependent methyltransferase
VNWAGGYVTQVDYTYGYYRELNPALLRFACLSAGVSPPAGPLNYLELGFGQGVALNVHAAASGGEFWGNDFNPVHAAHAVSLADASGSGVRLLEDSFEELAARADLPEFDVIALHGVWTWIPDKDRRPVIDLIRRKLRVGGLVYISYNTQPGWAAATPLHHLLAAHVELGGVCAGGMVGKIEAALAFAQQVAGAGAGYFAANPGVADRLKAISALNRNYLAHEFFNREWSPMPFSVVAQRLEEAKLSYVTSSNLLEHVDAVCISEQTARFLAGIENPILRQTVRDYFMNQQFRRDIYVKGARRPTATELEEAFLAQTLVLAVHPKSISYKLQSPIGEVTMSEQAYGPVIDALAADDFAPKSVAQIAADPKVKALPPGQLIEALRLLVGTAYVEPAQTPADAARRACAALNAHLCDRARISGDIVTLASPVTGGGVGVSRIQQLFLVALREGRKTIAEQAKFTWDNLAALNQRILKDNKTLESADDNIAELKRQAAEFAELRLPILRALEIA